MNSIRTPNRLLEGLEPYDPKYLPADIIASANENPLDVPQAVRDAIAQRLESLPFNRYPDPLANELRDAIAASWGLRRECVLVGNGGDELLYNLAMAWGGQGREMLIFPPTFSTYAASAHLASMQVKQIDRLADYSLDDQAIFDYLEQGDPDIIVVCSPNNPTGNLAPRAFVEKLLASTDALVIVDEAYGEFSRESTVDLLAEHENLAILRTFSKAYSLAGVRVGYLLASDHIVHGLCRVRQPYSVDAVSQAIALECWMHKDLFEGGTQAILAERGRMAGLLASMREIEVFPSQANYILLRVPKAFYVWEKLYARGILVRDFSAGALTRDCLRVSVGTREENDAFLQALGHIVDQEREYLE